MAEEIKTDTPLKDLFISMGYTVDWDMKVETNEFWFDFFKDGKRVLQLDTWVPVEDFLEDCLCIAEGKDTTSKSNYNIHSSEEAFQIVLKDLKEHGKI